MREKRANDFVGQNILKHNFKGSLSLVIPCYNESKRVAHLLTTLKDFEANWRSPLEIIIVDDGSSDDTVQKIERTFKEAFDSKTAFQVLELGQNQGKGAALKAGVEKSTADYVLTIDADMAAEPQELNAWLEQTSEKTFPENKILIGSREHENSKIKGQLIRRFAGLVYNFIIQLFTNLNLTDTQCGFKLYPQAIAKNLFGQLKTTGWAHDIELLNQAKFEGIPILPMPVQWTHQDGSKISLVSDSIKMLFSTIGISFRQNCNWFIAQPVRDLKNGVKNAEESSLYRLLFIVAVFVSFLILALTSFGDSTPPSPIDKTIRIFGPSVVNTIAGILMVLFTGLLAKEVSGSWRAGFLALVLTAMSPFFVNYQMDVFSDVPFVMAYVFTLLHLTRFIHQFPKPGSKTILMLIIGMMLSLGIKSAGFLALYLFFIPIILSFLAFFYFKKIKSLALSFIVLTAIVPIVYTIFKTPALDEGVRHFSFIYPILIVLIVWVWNQLIRYGFKRIGKRG